MNDSLILINANIITMNPAQSRAQAAAAREGRIVAVGSVEDVRNFMEDARVIDLNGKTVLPGLIDSHVHFTSTGIKAMAIDYSHVNTIAETQAILHEAREMWSTQNRRF